MIYSRDKVYLNFLLSLHSVGRPEIKPVRRFPQNYFSIDRCQQHEKGFDDHWPLTHCTGMESDTTIAHLVFEDPLPSALFQGSCFCSIGKAKIIFIYHAYLCKYFIRSIQA